MAVSDVDLGWLAGFFDGEGCVSLSKHGKKHPRLTLSFTNSEQALIQKAQRILDALEIDSYITEKKKYHPNWLPSYDLNIDGATSVRRFFSLVPIDSLKHKTKYEKLSHYLPIRGQSHSPSRRERLARQYPQLALDGVVPLGGKKEGSGAI